MRGFEVYTPVLNRRFAVKQIIYAENEHAAIITGRITAPVRVNFFL